MNSDQFVFWLQGFLEGSPVMNNPEFLRSAITKKMKEVKLVGQTYHSYTPQPWYINTTPAIPVTPKITCDSSTAINLPNKATVSFGSNTMGMSGLGVGNAMPF